MVSLHIFGKNCFTLSKCVLSVIFFFILCSTIQADMVHLRNGEKVEGIVLEIRGNTVSVQVDSGTMAFSLTEISKIERSDPAEAEALIDKWKNNRAAINRSVEADKTIPSAPSKIAWVYTYDKGMAKAKNLKMPVMIDFYTKWCGWCQKLDGDTYTDKGVLALSAKFVCIKINAEMSRALATQYGINGYPTIVFLNPEGSELYRIRGYLEPKSFAEQMKKVLQ